MRIQNRMSHPHSFNLRLVLIALLTVSLLPSIAPAAPTPVSFSKDVWPLLESSCISCHGPEKQKGGLRLDSKSAAFRGGDDGSVIVPGRSAQSLLIRLVTGEEPDRVMPAKGRRLSDEQIATLRAWIDQGASWPASPASAATALEKSDWWSFKPATRPAPPPVHDPRWVRNPIDAFVLNHLEQENLRPSLEADRRTLIRRLSFDLTGLPPTPDEVEDFLADPVPDAYEKLADRLLASPRYGERWARHWLDVVHFGETHGYDKDKTRPNAWPYRDYVIQSFNGDKPYPASWRSNLPATCSFPPTPTRGCDRLHRRRTVGLCRPHRAARGHDRQSNHPLQRPRRHGHDRDVHLPKPHRPLRPLPQPQVRPHHPGRLLPPASRLRRH